MSLLKPILSAMTIAVFTLGSSFASETITKEEAINFVKQFIDDGKRICQEQTDVNQEPSLKIKNEFYSFLESKLSSGAVRTILGRNILSNVKEKGMNADDYIKSFTPDFIRYVVKFYSSPEKMKIFQKATYDDKTAKSEVSPDGKMVQVKIAFSYDDKNALVQFYVIKENGGLKLDDLGLEGISQKGNQVSEIRAFFSAPDKGKGDAKVFLDWFTAEMSKYFAR